MLLSHDAVHVLYVMEEPLTAVKRQKEVWVLMRRLQKYPGTRKEEAKTYCNYTLGSRVQYSSRCLISQTRLITGG